MRLHARTLLIAGGTFAACLLAHDALGAQGNGVTVRKAFQSVLTVSATPTLIIGGNEADESTMFGAIVGATRLPDGRILVGDRGEYSLRVFSPDGVQLKRLGRKGSGLGERVRNVDTSAPVKHTKSWCLISRENGLEPFAIRHSPRR